MDPFPCLHQGFGSMVRAGGAPLTDNMQLYDKTEKGWHTAHLQKGYIIYTFTDGYADQFGGPKGKKFKLSHLKEKLVEICDKTLSEQKEILEKTFEDWKGELEQIDDVLIIGIRIR